MAYNKSEILILMAVYNGQSFIEEQLLSILNQSYSHIHIIVSDNCSEDKTLEIVSRISRKYPEKITILTSGHNQGVVGNFAKLIAYADADYIMFSDSDDVWLPNKIELTLQKMHEMEQLHGNHLPLLVHTDLSVVDRKLKCLHKSFWKFSGYAPHRHMHLNRQLAQNVITGCSVMINRPLLDLSKSIPKGIIMHDWWLGLIALAFGRVSIVDKPTILYRQHGGNDTGAKKYSLMAFLKQVKRKEADTYSQARLFLEFFENKLNPDQKAAVQAYLSKEKSSFISRVYLIYRYGFYKHGLLRNLRELIR